MNYLLLPILLIGQAADPVELKSRIVEASVFKSGLVMLTREVEVPAGEGFYKLDVVPEALDGTFWYRSPDQLGIGDIETTLRIKERKDKRPAQTMMDLLAANLGKRVTVAIRAYGPPPTVERVTGDLMSIGQSNYQGGQVLLKLENGDYRATNAAEIVQIESKGLETQVERTIKVPELNIRFKAKAPKPAKLQFITLETGAAWLGSYLVTLGADMRATVEGKAQLGVGALKFQDTNVSAMAGAPNLPTAVKYDLSAGYGSLMAYLSNTQERYRQFRPGPVDPYTLLPSIMQQNQQAFNQGGYVGGFGGGGMGGGGGLSYENADEGVVYNRPAPDDMRHLSAQPELERIEGLFSYPLGKVDLEPGDRLSRMLFSQTAPYTRLLTWEANINNRDVRDVVRLSNTSKVPWTGGTAFVVRDNRPLAQVQMPFTSLGRDADLELGMARDIPVSREDRQVRIEDYASPDWPRSILKKAYNEVKLTIENARDVPIRLEISTIVNGEPTASQGATITKLTRQTDAYNWQRRVSWTVDLKPGERREIVFNYSVVFSVGVRQ